MSLKTTLRNAPRQAARALLRTPLEVLLGAAAWIVIALAIEDLATDNTATRLAITTAIALPLVYGTSFLAASGTITRWIRWLIATTAIAAAGLYGFLLFDPDLTAERWRAATLIAASILALLAAPLASWQPNGPGRRALVYRFATRLTVRVAIVGLYAAALYAGLAAALAAVNGLFSLELPSRLYTHLAALVFALLPPWAIAAGLPALVAPPAPWGEITLRALRRTALLLLAPLIGIYLLIVYAYIVRILVTGEVPSNLISPVVLGAGALTLAATLLVEPLHGRDDAITLTRFVRTLPPLLLPLTGLALWAVLIRVGQYGWTEFRYLRVLAILLLGAFAIAGSWRLILRRLPPLTALPAIAAATLAIATISPLSAPAVSLRSQETRLTTLLAEARGQHQPPTPDTLHTPDTPATPVTPDALAEITSRARYLRDHFGDDALRPFLASGSKLPTDRSAPALAAALGITEAVDDALPRIIHAALPEDAGIPGVTGGTVYLVAYQRLTLDTAGTRITLHPPAGPPLTAEIAPLANRIARATLDQVSEPLFTYDAPSHRPAITTRTTHAELPATEAALTLTGPDGRPRGQIVLQRLTIRVIADYATVTGWSGLLILSE